MICGGGGGDGDEISKRSLAPFSQDTKANFWTTGPVRLAWNKMGTQTSCSTLHRTLEAIQLRNVEGEGLEGGGGASHRLAYVEVRGKRSAGNWPFKDVEQAGVWCHQLWHLVPWCGYTAATGRQSARVTSTTWPQKHYSRVSALTLPVMSKAPQPLLANASTILVEDGNFLECHFVRHDKSAVWQMKQECVASVFGEAVMASIQPPRTGTSSHNISRHHDQDDRNFNFHRCGNTKFIWVWNLVSRIEGGTYTRNE